MKATLVKRATDDGLVEVEDRIALGRVYEVQPGSRHTVVMFNTAKGCIHEKEVISAKQTNGDWGWVPTELLDLAPDA